ncbi:MAG: MBL fold metallo-hydrolase [Candidatus Gracilibacteria bacterium]|nr:MBL fold metallo-hydrolase [Candidatus Gracilibacteria bacterium]
MKIQFFGGKTFGLFAKNARVVLDAPAKFPEKKLDIATTSTEEDLSALDAKKVLSLPGEYEISEILVKGFQPKQGRVTFKITMEDIAVAHFPAITLVPEAKFIDRLGENVDVVLLPLGEDLTPKTAKKLIEEIDPRVVIFGGDPQFFPEIKEMTGAQILEENSVDISRSKLPEEKTEYWILST